jgi:hypothetical protein
VEAAVEPIWEQHLPALVAVALTQGLLSEDSVDSAHWLEHQLLLQQKLLRL